MLSRKLFAPGRYPDFIIIGAQKAGTTSLHHYLSQHPQLVESNPKELHFFDSRIHAGYTMRWYKSQFAAFRSRDRLFYESTPSYLYDPDVPQLIRDHLPGIKLICILREPKRRAYSAWNMYREFQQNQTGLMKLLHPLNKHSRELMAFFYGQEKFPGFKESILFELEQMNRSNHLEPSLLRRGRYAQQLKRYLDLFPSGAMLVLGFEELKNKTEATLNKISSFLGIDEFQVNSMDLQPQNVRLKESRISEGEDEILGDYFKHEASELEALLGCPVEW